MSEHIHEIEALLLLMAIGVMTYRLAMSKEGVFGAMLDKFKENQQAFLTISSTVLLAGCILLLVFKPIPPSSEKLLDSLVVAIATQWVMVMNFWFGSSSGSAKKTDILAANQQVKEGN